MAVTSNNGIYTTSGGGNLTVSSVFLNGDGIPSTPPTDVNELWFYQDVATGLVYYWSISGSSWVKFLGTTHGGFNGVNGQTVTIPNTWQKIQWSNSSGAYWGDALLFYEPVFWPNNLIIPRDGVYLVTAQIGLFALDQLPTNVSAYLRLKRTSQVDTTFVASTVSLTPLTTSDTNGSVLISTTLSGQTIFTENDLLSFEIMYNNYTNSLPLYTAYITIAISLLV